LDNCPIAGHVRTGIDKLDLSSSWVCDSQNDRSDYYSTAGGPVIHKKQPFEQLLNPGLLARFFEI
jgi:hypothetical protein